MDRVRYTRIYSDNEGESHAEEVEIELKAMSYAPPAPAAWASAFLGATGYHFLSVPPGWYGDWHPVPRRGASFYLKGEMEVEVSDGARLRFRFGDIVLVEDTSGKGHRSWVVGGEDLLVAVVVLPDRE